MQAQRAQRPRLILCLAALGIAVALIGFAKTFFYPLFTGSFHAPLAIYLHGAFLFSWVTFFFSQSLWIHRKNLKRHKAMGRLGAAIVAGVVSTTLIVATLASRRTAASGDLDIASRELLIIMIEMASFATLISAAFLLRRTPDAHKRLMLLAFIASLGPAWFRFRHYFPPVENPILFYSVLLADSLVIIAAAADFLRERRVHWVYLSVGAAMIGVHLLEVFAFDAPWFHVLANALARPFI